MNVLEIKELNKSFGNHQVINNLNLTVPQHTIFGFIGLNGAGKTTTMKMILGLLKADSGFISVCDQTVKYGSTKTNINVGYLPDVPAFYDYMRPKEYLALCGEITGLNKQEIKKRSDELLKLVGLADVNRKIAGFSRGMKQRLGIAQALLNEPKLLICDEPTSALDPIGRQEILDILLAIKDKTTVLFSTHILSDVERICDEVAILNGGKIVLQGTLEHIKAHYQSDAYLIEFNDFEQLKLFSSQLDQSQLQYPDEKHPSVVVMTKNLKQDGQLLIDLLTKHQITPLKFERLEPDLEKLFMEVLK